MIPGLGGSPGGGGPGSPLQDACLENPKDRRAWWATAHRVTKSAHSWERGAGRGGLRGRESRPADSVGESR